MTLSNISKLLMTNLGINNKMVTVTKTPVYSAKV